MSHRFFSETRLDFDPDSPAPARLTDAEAHHFLHVMRGSVGDRVTLFDGSGREFEAEATETSRREVTLALRSCAEVDREPAVGLTLGVALPKGDRQKVLVEKLTELGVARLVPLTTERSVVAPKASGLDKLRRAVIEASKQCGRNRLMAIDEPAALTRFLETAEADARWIAHPYSGSQPEAIATGSCTIAVGPEGGFTEPEVAAAAATGWAGVALGKSLLRIETAAIALAALVTCGDR
ncbi:Ribosomal RNA small subunit methyltransferase E [Planctomycetes bacterium MalM25]|nr:Ribosomal RNA small subunit methyltransferase E [Planctomycetes bacterium MalM25]